MMVPQYEIEYSDEKVTAWGGMRLMKEVLERSGVSRHLSEAPLPEPGSNRGYSPSVMVGSFLVNVWMGCYRMSHTEVLRRDDTLKALFGCKQTPSGSSYGRFFNKFSQARNQAVFPTLQQRFMENIPGLVVDVVNGCKAGTAVEFLSADREYGCRVLRIVCHCGREQGQQRQGCESK